MQNGITGKIQIATNEMIISAVKATVIGIVVVVDWRFRRDLEVNRTEEITASNAGKKKKD